MDIYHSEMLLCAGLLNFLIKFQFYPIKSLSIKKISLIGGHTKGKVVLILEVNLSGFTGICGTINVSF